MWASDGAGAAVLRVEVLGDEHTGRWGEERSRASGCGGGAARVNLKHRGVIMNGFTSDATEGAE